ncbi:MAG TPA: energy-coupling factor ABC transporter permease [Bacteroidota bacterium]|nr:energy-coupling factor ABC transporter permease [Bacteroidota bacterium]
MHVPDGFLDLKTAAATGVLSTAALAVSLRRLNVSLPRKNVPLMGLAGAFVFAAQMVNFPVAGGTSGHLIGGVLVAVLLGPAAGVLIMASVLIVQCLLFADGGILALGANVFNMGVISSAGGYAIFRGISLLVRGDRGKYLGIILAAWCSTVIAAVCCAGELAWSGTVSWDAAFPAMANVHMLIALGEAVITALVYSAIAAVRPELTAGESPATRSGKDLLLYGGMIAVGVVLFITPFASTWPDGLEAVAGRLGFRTSSLAHPPLSSPLAEYTIPGIGSPAAATVIAGLAGTCIVFAAGLVVARVLARRGGREA